MTHTRMVAGALALLAVGLVLAAPALAAPAPAVAEEGRWAFQPAGVAAGPAQPE